MARQDKLKREVDIIKRALSVEETSENLTHVITEYMAWLDRMTEGMSYPERTEFERKIAHETAQTLRRKP